MEQNFEEWKKSNPNGSLNDYYRRGNNVKTVSVVQPTQYEILEVKKPQENNNHYFIGIGICIVGFIGFFSPWFTIPIFNVSVSGNDIVQLTNVFKSHIDATKVNLLQYAFVIPITYGIVTLGAITKNYLFSAIGAIANLFVVGFLLGKIFADMPDLLSYINIGLYLIGLSWIGMLYYLIALR